MRVHQSEDPSRSRSDRPLHHRHAACRVEARRAARESWQPAPREAPTAVWTDWPVQWRHLYGAQHDYVPCGAEVLACAAAHSHASRLAVSWSDRRAWNRTRPELRVRANTLGSLSKALRLRICAGNGGTVRWRILQTFRLISLQVHIANFCLDVVWSRSWSRD